MKAVVYHGKANVSVDTIPDPQLLQPTDAIIKVTSTAMCGADLHAYGGYVPGMEEGDVLGHECMGEVVERGERVTQVNIGERVIVPFIIACGECFFCVRGAWAHCDRTNTNKALLEQRYGRTPAGMFGYSHLYGGYAGAQAQYLRVPYAHRGLFAVPAALPDEKVLFIGDSLAAGYLAAEHCAIQPHDTVAIWGAGPVGQFAAKSARLLGARHLVVIDCVPERLLMAEEESGAVTINFKTDNVAQALNDFTHGRGPNKCIDAVGLESHASGLASLYDKARHLARLETDRPTALQQILTLCQKGSTISVAGTYIGTADAFALGTAFHKGLQLKLGQAHVHAAIPKLLGLVENGTLDPSFVITHLFSLQQAPEAYTIFRDKKDDCIKVVLDPWEA